MMSLLAKVVEMLLIVVAICAILSCNAQPVIYDLSMVTRPAQPWLPLRCYDSTLTRSSEYCTGDYVVKTSYHHIIDYQKFFDLWNHAAETGNLICLSNPLRRLKEKYPSYKSYLGRYEERVITLIDEILTQQIVHGPGDTPDFFDDLSALWGYYPCDTFNGPSGEFRTDDPGQRFEKDSNTIIGSSNYFILDNLYKDIEQCLGDQSSCNCVKIERLGDDMVQVLKCSAPYYSLVADDWTPDIDSPGKYRITPTTRVKQEL